MVHLPDCHNADNASKDFELEGKPLPLTTASDFVRLDAVPDVKANPYIPESSDKSPSRLQEQPMSFLLPFPEPE